VYLWGSGLNGRLGNGESSSDSVPTLSQELKDKAVASIIMGTNTTFAILENLNVFGWGSSKGGKLGFELANGKNYELPKEIIALKDKEIFQIAAGPFHTLLLTVDGKMLSMGNSKDGKLGYSVAGGGVVEVELPIRIPKGPVFFKKQVARTELKRYPLFDDYDEHGKLKVVYHKDDMYEINQICCGENFQIFLTNDGDLYACGSNKCGQLGAEEDSDQGDRSGDDQSEGLGDEEADGDESLFMNAELQKKYASLQKKEDRWTPRAIKWPAGHGTIKIRSVAAGAQHVIALAEADNTVLAWGKNTHGQLGTGDKEDYVFRPTPIKAFGQDRDAVKQVACGENHSVFLMNSSCVMTCGSNEFGQLGLVQDAAGEAGVNPQGGRQPHTINIMTTPVLIEKSLLDGVVLVAAGKYHTLAVKKQNEVEELNGDDDEREGGLDKTFATNPLQTQRTAAGVSLATLNEDEIKEKVIIKDIKHELYGWGRSYHGQLGLNQQKLVQWTPKKIRLKNDLRFKEDEQPTRFAMITCGEKHSLILAVNGAIWWTGHKGAVGKVDPNEVRKCKFEPKDDRLSYQYTFEPYFDPTSYDEFARMKFKYINSNFSSRISWAINKENVACVFGQDVEFQKLDSEEKFVFGASGKRFQSLIHVERLPYTWGELKNGKLGIGEMKATDEAPDNIENNPNVKLSSKRNKVKKPVLIEFFACLRR